MHLEICSYTIPKSPLEDKWGTLAKAWVNRVSPIQEKCVFRLIIKNRWKDKVLRRRL
jgi:hypothetical protein